MKLKKNQWSATQVTPSVIHLFERCFGPVGLSFDEICSQQVFHLVGHSFGQSVDNLIGNLMGLSFNYARFCGWLIILSAPAIHSFGHSMCPSVGHFGGLKFSHSIGFSGGSSAGPSIGKSISLWVTQSFDKPPIQPIFQSVTSVCRPFCRTVVNLSVTQSAGPSIRKSISLRVTQSFDQPPIQPVFQSVTSVYRPFCRSVVYLVGNSVSRSIGYLSVKSSI